MTSSLVVVKLVTEVAVEWPETGGCGDGGKGLEADVVLEAIDVSSGSGCALLCVPKHSGSRGMIPLN